MFTRRKTVVQAFEQHRCSAILRTAVDDAVQPAMEAAIAGGFAIVEFTLNTPRALDHITGFCERGDVLVGAGTVLTIADAAAAVEAGASFLVSPVFDPEVVAWCQEHDVASIPGTYTPTEMLAAHNAGADMVKLFPGPANGPDHVRACRGPLPFLKIFPTSGVTEDNVDDYLAAGSFGVGFVNCLFDPSDMNAGRFDAIGERATRMTAKVEAFFAGVAS